MLRPRLLFIFPGPVYDIHQQFEARFRALSEFYGGQVVVTGPGEQEVSIGHFDFTVVRHQSSRQREFRDVHRHVRRLSDEARRLREKIDLVIAYDPLRSGLIGRSIAATHDSGFVVEVNGDYADPANYLDISNGLIRFAKRAGYVAIERHVLARAHGIKLLYDTQLDHVIDTTGAIRRSFPNHVDLRGFVDRGETEQVLFVGHPFYLKGVDLLVDAFKQLAPHFPSWRLKLLGWFEDQREVERCVAGHPQIEIHPPVHRSQMPWHMGSCGIFVLPSRTEAMGRVLLEAAACGKPRIGAAVGGIPSVISHGRDGLLFTKGDATDLATQLRVLMSNPEVRRSMGRAAERRASDEFTIDRYIDNTKSLYDAVLTQRWSRSALAGK